MKPFLLLFNLRKWMIVPSLLVLLALGNLSGCRAISYLIAPDARAMVEAKHKFTKGIKIAVLIDDYLAPVNNPGTKSALAKKIGDGLVEAGALRPGDLVSTEAVAQLPKDTLQGKKLSIQNIGKQVNADQVLYINIVEFNLQSDPENPLIQPKARAFVKVINVSDGDRLWPIDVTGEPLEAKSRMEGDILSEKPDTALWADRLSNLLASEVIGLFFDHREVK
jgi:hypothetical protein